jgi:hypothetical protein
MPQSIPQSNEQPTEPPTDTPHDTGEDTYDNEHTTSTSIRKRSSADTHAQHERIPQSQPEPPRASSPSLMDALIAQNIQTMESNRQMMQAFMQTMERLAPSRQASSSPPYPPPQSTANPYDSTKQQIKQLSEKSKLIRPTYANVVVRGAEDYQRQAFARLLHNPTAARRRTREVPSHTVNANRPFFAPQLIFSEQSEVKDSAI